jgi:activating signal cointegrator 1
MTTDLQTQLDQKNYQYMLQRALEQNTIRALSLTEPWSTLVAVGAKKQETRTWHPHITLETIAIQSAKGFTADNEAYCSREHFQQALEEAGYTPDITQRRRQDRWGFPFGQITAIAWLRDVYQLAPLVWKSDLPPEPERSFGNYHGGRYIWLLPYVYRLKTPIPVVGHQLLWNWTPTEEFREEIRNALALYDPNKHLIVQDHQ